MSNSAWDTVLLARDAKRATAQYYINNIFEDFIELHGDKLYADDAAVIGGIGRIDGMPVTVVGQEKGVSLSEKLDRNFGSAHPEGYRKTLRLMRQAEKFHRPLICIVDTQGAFCGIGAEERGMGEALARNLLELSRLKTPVISILIGEGGSGGAIALAVSDRLAMLQNAMYSILSPEGFSSILWKDSGRAQEAAALMKITASDVYDMGLIDTVIPEEEPAQADDGGVAAQNVKDYIARCLGELTQKPIETLLSERYGRIRSFGREYIR